MSEFTTGTTKVITPVLSGLGFKKRGRFSRSSTHDVVVYRRDDVELKLTFAFHPYDYPDVGIRVQLRDALGLRSDSLYGPTHGGTDAILRAILKDLVSRDLCTR